MVGILKSKNGLQILYYILLILLVSCSDSEQLSHDKTIIELRQHNQNEEVILKTAVADFYFDKQELIDYCNQENNGEPNDFTFPKIIDYIQSFDSIPIVIPDTLGTKMEIADELYVGKKDSLIRVRDQNHPYAYIAEEIKWAVLEFAAKGKLRIYDKKHMSFLKQVTIDKVEASFYGETNILSEDDFVILSMLRWIQ